MPIEVRELVIRATVEPPAPPPPPATAPASGDASARQAAALVLDALRRQSER